MVPPVSVLFVCLGNHCRSPSAHAVADSLLAGRPFARFDSAGTGRDHLGDPPHQLAANEGAARGYTLQHLGRQVDDDDFSSFDLIVAMDRWNVSDLERRRGGVERRSSWYRTAEPTQVQLLRRWDPAGSPDADLDDPWGRGADAYRSMFDVLERTLPVLLDHLERLHREHP